MLIWFIIEIFVNFLQVFVFFKAYDLYYNKRINCKYVLEITIIVMATALTILNHYVSIDSNPFYYFGYIMLIYIISMVIFEGNIFSKAAILLLFITAMGICELLAAVIVTLVTGIEMSLISQQNFTRFEVMVISQTLYVYFYLMMKKRIDKDKFNSLNNKYYALVGTILLLTVTTIIFVIWMNVNIDANESVNKYLVMLTTCVSLLSITAIAMIDRIIKDMDEKNKNDLELQKIKMENMYFSDVNSVLEEIRILKHDMRGELAIIHGYNQLNQRDKIDAHIEKKLKELDIHLIQQIDSENIITSFLNFKVREAISKDIKFEIETNLTDDIEILIDKEEICRVLNNIINNAIEANEKCDEKYINLSINMIDKYFIIQSENPYMGKLLKKGNKLLTLKEDKANHGYGLKSIKNIAEKHYGFMEISSDDNVFKISVQMMNKNTMDIHSYA
ncbi:GHKL domain-containing protein [Sedimentibacter sp.]|uniref:sensor histidine kinase n=1 Tax=Sedimentibacter sp. TaxID=1960295 RepID=UPI00289B2B94|nr:GHKL domain-containing protein [Sedimentibacter sp.]